MPAPYQKRIYENPAGYGRISDLIRQKGVIEADREQQSAARSAVLVTNIADIAGQSLGTYARLKADEPRQKRAAAQLAKEEKAERRGENLRGIQMMYADQPLEEQEKTLRREGFGPEANVVRQQHQQETQMALARIGQHKSDFGQATQLLQEVQQRPELYPQVRTRLMEMAQGISPELAAEIPETYEPAKVQGMLQFAQSALQANDIAERTLVKLQKADDLVRKGLNAEQDYREAIGIAASRTNSQEEWDTLMQGFRARGVPEERIAEFGSWTKDAPMRAREKLLTPAQLEARDQPKPVTAERLAAMSPEERARVLASTRQLAAASQAPERPSDFDKYLNASPAERARMDAAAQSFYGSRRAEGRGGGITEEQRNVAERWKQGQLKDLEEQFGKQFAEALDEDAKKQLTKAHTEAKDRIQQSFEAQVGVRRAAPGAPDVPPQVIEGLQGEPPGIYENVRDPQTKELLGTFMIGPDGTIRRMQPRAGAGPPQRPPEVPGAPPELPLRPSAAQPPGLPIQGPMQPPPSMGDMARGVGTAIQAPLGSPGLLSPRAWGRRAIEAGRGLVSPNAPPPLPPPPPRR